MVNIILAIWSSIVFRQVPHACVCPNVGASKGFMSVWRTELDLVLAEAMMIVDKKKKKKNSKNKRIFKKSKKRRKAEDFSKKSPTILYDDLKRARKKISSIIV